jgi:hypothetical protein
VFLGATTTRVSLWGGWPTFALFANVGFRWRKGLDITFSRPRTSGCPRFVPFFGANLGYALQRIRSNTGVDFFICQLACDVEKLEPSEAQRECSSAPIRAHECLYGPALR